MRHQHHHQALARVSIGGFHRGVELACIGALFARAVARAFASAERHVIVDTCGRQIDHHHARLAVALEMRGILEAGGADAGGKAEVGVVGDRQGMLQGLAITILLGLSFTGVTNSMRIAREEIFGPVAAVIRAKNYGDALAIANDTDFGLAAGVCTTSLKYASHFKRNSEAGMVMVNLPTAGVDYHVPFGGRKGSSYGAREQGAYAREFYTTVKTAYTFPG